MSRIWSCQKVVLTVKSKRTSTVLACKPAHLRENWGNKKEKRGGNDPVRRLFLCKKGVSRVDLTQVGYPVRPPPPPPPPHPRTGGRVTGVQLPRIWCNKERGGEGKDTNFFVEVLYLCTDGESIEGSSYASVILLVNHSTWRIWLGGWQNNRLNYCTQSLHVGMQPAAHLSIVFFQKQKVKSSLLWFSRERDQQSMNNF